jgi:hypothetical protein
LNGVTPPSGKLIASAPFVSGKDDDGVVELAYVLELF